ncbi:hypothetical protein BLNAU_13974 [Blattamonas nauphoetae]|uniref:Secreted protein n=1 Tax=Blattamonas nauphoetae TaxID=2049346 RepID=A0ABQ9XLK6_9EUKA|nr:hypothetical protein BLNAU_13974 [Blattamonas nauphoetae]
MILVPVQIIIASFCTILRNKGTCTATRPSHSLHPPQSILDGGWVLLLMSPQAALRGDSVMLNDDGRGGDSDHIDTAPTKEISLKS